MTSKVSACSYFLLILVIVMAEGRSELTTEASVKPKDSVTNNKTGNTLLAAANASPSNEPLSKRNPGVPALDLMDRHSRPLQRMVELHNETNTLLSSRNRSRTLYCMNSSIYHEVYVSWGEQVSIHSYNHPNAYSMNTHCGWVFMTAPQHRVEFSCSTCDLGRGDFISIHGTPMGACPFTHTTDEETAMFVFVSDEADEGKGFRCTVQVAREEQGGKNQDANGFLLESTDGVTVRTDVPRSEGQSGSERPSSGDSEGPSSGDSEGPSSGDSEGPSSGDSEGPSSGDSEGPSSGDSEGPSSGDSDGPSSDGEGSAAMNGLVADKNSLQDGNGEESDTSEESIEIIERLSNAINGLSDDVEDLSDDIMDSQDSSEERYTFGWGKQQQRRQRRRTKGQSGRKQTESVDTIR